MLLAQLPNLDARSREDEKFRLDNLQMKIGSAIIAAGFSLLGMLAVRRAVLVSLARRRWNTLAVRLGLARRPIGCFRVALTGPSSGIGQACMELLKDYPGVIVTPIGRNLSPPCGIQVDLTDGSAVRRGVFELISKWYTSSQDPSDGHDIFINNAGVFTSLHSAHVWETNVVAPCFMTETLSSMHESLHIKGRKLRFVQVTSRLEKRSSVDKTTVRAIANGALYGTDQNQSVNVYADTKRALLLHTAYMSSTHRGQISNVAVTPGMVNTNLGKSSVTRLLWFISAPLRFVLLRHPIEGAVAVLHAAFGYPDENGIYVDGSDEILERISETRDAEAGRIVSEIVNLHFNIV